jgi:NDP-sugar pyrophosphorylase family protein
MAGVGSRFVNAGYTKPKPFIDVAGKPMIVRVLDNLAIPNARYVLVARREHLQAEIDLVRQIEQSYQAIFVQIDNITEGTACTVLHARKLINNSTPLLIANSDQIVDFNPIDYVNDCVIRNLDGSILTFKDETRNPKWSFARTGEDGLVQEVKEKKPISDCATVGIYLFKHGEDFVNAAIDMFLHQDRVNNEYYTCPSYNYLIKENKNIGIYNVPAVAMHGVGTPEDLELYLNFLSDLKA